MPPNWLTAIAWTYIAGCVVCAGTILYDITCNGRRQPMGVMNWVFPTTALYFGPFALALYWRLGRVRVPATNPTTRAPVPSRASDAPTHAMAMASMGASGAGHGDQPEGQVEPGQAATLQRPWWATMAIEVSHCGSGCALGDLIAEWLIFTLALTVAGYALFAEYIGDYLFAVALGIVFQYFAIAPMRGLGVKDGLTAAAKADIVSLTFFEIGLFGWMALMAFVFFPAPHHLTPTSAAYWFLMQIGMIIGFFTSWPANVWLVKRGIKVPM